MRREREELLAESVTLAESVRGKERQMRYLAVGWGGGWRPWRRCHQNRVRRREARMRK